ncbi:MAG: alcohol dehydrogenase, partial [Promethearchaeota archaeon]
ELTVIGSWGMIPSEHPEIIDLIRDGLPAEQMITHKFNIDDASKAFKAFFSGEAVKVLINPWE